MTNTFNQISLLGRITHDVELKSSKKANGEPFAFCNFSVAVQRNFKNKNGEYEADFINCKASGKTAEFVGKFFGTKGSLISLSGSMKNNNYTDDQGVKHYSDVVSVDSINFVPGTKKDKNDSYNSSLSQAGKSTENPMSNRDFDIIGEDDLPF